MNTPSQSVQDRIPIILVVDDDPSVREAIAEVLRDERYVVATAANGLQAMDMLRAGLRPAVVLLDLWMPQLDGFEALQQMKKEAALADIPVIVITADHEAKREDLARDVDVVLRKPIDLNRLLTHVWRQTPARPDS